MGIGWRPEIDLTVERLPGVDFVEVIAESIHVERLPASLLALRARHPVLPHGVSLSLGRADPPASGTGWTTWLHVSVRWTRRW